MIPKQLAKVIGDRPVCIHASMRSFSPRWDTGAKGLLADFQQTGATVLVPTFSNQFATLPSDSDRPKRNATDEAFIRSMTQNDRVFTIESRELDVADMGVFSDAVLQKHGAARGYHPLGSFAALGPQAHDLVAGQSPDDVFAPLRELVGREGRLLLIGVSFRSLTFVHYCEQVAGREMFIRWANDAHGSPMRVRVGGCSSGFDQVEAIAQEAITEFNVQGSRWLLVDPIQLTEIVVSAIQVDPSLTHCGDKSCGRCSDAQLGGPQI